MSLRGHIVSTYFFAKCLRVDEDGPGLGHPCHLDTFPVSETLAACGLKIDRCSELKSK